MTIERIDFWDKCLGSGNFGLTVRQFPDEARLLFGDGALQQGDPTELALIIFARRILVMTDEQIKEMQARIQKDVADAESSRPVAFHHFCIPLQDPSTISLPPVVSLALQSSISAKSGNSVDRVRETAKMILRKNGLGPFC